MTDHEKLDLPWELVEEILSRVSPKSLVRFRSVSKQWNALFNNKTFINNHKAKFQFILATNSKIYSVRIDPIIVVRELNLCTGSLQPRRPKYLVEGDNFVLCGMDSGAAVWNPWFPVQARWIKTKTKVKGKGKLECHGICYNPRDQESVDKAIWSYRDTINWRIHDLASHAWKDVKEYHDHGQNDHHHHYKYGVVSQSGVSLNGSLYWIGVLNRSNDTCLFHLIKFDFSKERFYKSGDLPCVLNHPCDALVLRVFHGDRLTLLKQCHVTKKIDIWVSKNNGDKVGWENLMTFSDPNLPSLLHSESYSQPSYFIDDDDDERLVVCCCDETGRAWIYVMGQNELISQTRIESVVDCWPLHCTHIPNLVPVPKKSNRRSRFDDYVLY